MMITGFVVLASVGILGLGFQILRELIRSSWGRSFDQELDRILRGGRWLSTADICEALSLEIIRRSDELIMARKSAS